MRPRYHPHPCHFYEDKAGVIHYCDGAQLVPSDGATYIVWTLCEKLDVPADTSFMSNETAATCPACLEKHKENTKTR